MTDYKLYSNIYAYSTLTGLLFDWVLSESFEWFLWALLFTFLLTIFNSLFQSKVEKTKGYKQVIFLSLIDFLIMSYGIFIGGQIAFAGLAGEIELQTF